VFTQRNAQHAARMCSPRSEILAGSVDGSVRRFDVRAGALWADQLGSPVTSIALSHDGNCVLASCLDGALRLLDKGGGELLAQYSGAHPLFGEVYFPCM
jgi:mitogen-activated protein kinase organizer 1